MGTKRIKRKINIPQKEIVKAEIQFQTDLVDWAILDFIHDFCHNYARARRIVCDGERYTRINYAYMIESMPMLGIKDKNAISRRIQKLKKLGLIKTHYAPENTLYIAVTQKCLDIFESKPTETAPAGQAQQNEQQDNYPTSATELYSELEQLRVTGNEIVAETKPEPKFYAPDSPIDGLPHEAVVIRIVNYWNSRVSIDSRLKKCELKYEIYAAIIFTMQLKRYTEHDYYLTIDRYFDMLRAKRTNPAELKRIVLNF
jgi:hypothetical protein